MQWMCRVTKKSMSDKYRPDINVSFIYMPQRRMYRDRSPICLMYKCIKGTKKVSNTTRTSKRAKHDRAPHPLPRQAGIARSLELLQLRNHLPAQQFKRTHGVCMWHSPRLGLE